jgi:hypothetical protein
MPTPNECRYNAEICLRLAQETSEIYVKTALIELAEELRAMAKHLERSGERSTDFAPPYPRQARRL